MEPPFTLTEKILNTSLEISRLIGFVEGIESPEPIHRLRKENQIHTIHNTLAIEGNTLTLNQITAIIGGKRVLGDKKEILEVQNAIKVYENFENWKWNNSTSLLKSHRIMMKGLLDHPGQWRNQDVGIIKGKKVSHIVPPADRVHGLMKELFRFLNKKTGINLLIKACLFHYEFLFIHPFLDGNGRIARLWQQLILMHYHKIFRFISIESLIREVQTKYYQKLEISDQSGESTIFIEFMLDLVLIELKTISSGLKRKKITFEDRIKRAGELLKGPKFTRKDYLLVFKDISTATASRDLKGAVDKGILQKEGDKALAFYTFADK